MGRFQGDLVEDDLPNYSRTSMSRNVLSGSMIDIRKNRLFGYNKIQYLCRNSFICSLNPIDMQNKVSDFYKGFFAACVMGLLIVVLSSFVKDTQTKSGEIFSASSAISWNEALTLRSDFKSRSPLKIEVEEGGTIKQLPLEGFTIQANQLLEIINNNKSGGNADAIMFYFGSQDPAPGFSLPRYNIIAVGVSNNELMVPTNERDWSDPNKSSVFDKANPCPPMCPE